MQLKKLSVNVDTSLKKDDATTKPVKTTNTYFLPGLQTAADFNTGQLPFKSNGFSIEPAYRFKTGASSFISLATKVAPLRMNETQEYTEIKTIQPVQGTSVWRIDERHTNFNLRKALLIAPSLSFHYTFNRVGIGAGMQYGVLLSPNYTLKQSDTSSFYFQQPSFSVNAPFNVKRFNGNQFLASIFQVDVALTKHLSLIHI